ncbi:IucA/IucC family siderophore biosynthesis protein [Streptomyces sp. NBC_00083]|uniref:IucA/IucC family protein n=1 Tax=Streptomyces sp. NBC_00083 TaxID=2975647 RepID=UPI00225A523B|nr:IucA/IucC family protein [Streptomyces sp. NBC_00083]MCX5386106.1 IucA/IucC family siderophore biosynthesis protein [Streptomyces sp. NBC_00083]
MPNPPSPHDSRGLLDPEPPPGLLAPPELNPEAWDRAGRLLLAKMIGAFAYEEIVRPTVGPATDNAGPDEKAAGQYGFTLDDGSTLTFAARRGAYGGWQVDPDSVRRIERPAADTPQSAAGSAESPAEQPAGRSAGQPPEAPADSAEPPTGPRPARAEPPAGPGPAPTVRPDGQGPAGRPSAVPGGQALADPLRFLALARRTLGVDGATFGHLVRELSATLAADTRLHTTALPAAQLADLGYAELEGHQSGHPWLVLNKGRLGFSADDAARWSPEARTPARLPWIAVRTDLAGYRGTEALATPDRLYDRELDASVRASFAAALRARGLDPARYLYLPVHPWQWTEMILPLFAPAVADHAIVPLPTDGDVRLPQQSIRTFLNLSRPERHTVKLPLSILNTLVWRGLPTERTVAAPAVTAWVQGLCDRDAFLRDDCRVILLGEVASVAVEHPIYDRTGEVPYQYKELLGAIWREPLPPRLAAGERARTLAALLHTDPQGRAFTAELVARSGLAPQVWLRRLFGAILPPLLRFLYRYGTVFSPHGENAIVVFDDQDVPVRLAIKDFVDDINVSAEHLPEHDSMPDDVRRILLAEAPDFLTQFIHSGLFVGVFRFLAPLCEDQLGVAEADFWALVREEILRYQARFPDDKERYETFDLLTPRIDRLCLNRNRLHTDGYRDRSERPHATVYGTVANPLAQAE